MLAICTAYSNSEGNPEGYLRRIADADFGYLHWGHHWGTDFVYGKAELAQIEIWLKDFGLQLNEIHGSAGCEKSWGSHVAYQRQAGIELVKNRIDMAHRLGGRTVVMHTPAQLADTTINAGSWDQFCKVLDQLAPHAQRRGVRIALENLFPSNFDALDKAMAAYDPQFLGICYDPGHGNITRNGLERLSKLKNRLIALHLNDNDGQSDQHQAISHGTVDWPRLARIIATSNYDNPVMTMELECGTMNESEFFQRAFDTGHSFEKMVDQFRTGSGNTVRSESAAVDYDIPGS